MTEILKYWRNLTKDQREKIMLKNNIKVVLYEDIKRFYYERK